MLVVQPPPVSGIGNAGGFRMMVEDRAGRRTAGAAEAVCADDGPGGPDARLQQVYLAVRDVDAAALSRHRPRQGAAAGGRRRRRVQRAAGQYSARCSTSTTSTCSAAPSGCRRRPTRSPGSSRATCSRCGCAIRRRDGAARRVDGRPRHHRPVPRAALQPLSGRRARRLARRPAIRQGQAIEIMEKLAARDAAAGLWL